MKTIRKIPTPQSLARAAERYLERFASSEGSLERILKNTIYRAAMDNPDFASDEAERQKLAAAIIQIIEKYKKAGILNDDAYAEMKVNSLRRRGLSRSAIEQKLAQKGVKQSIVSSALKQHDEGADSEEAEFKAALAFAKRKRLGSFRKCSDAAQRRKDLASLSRAGFAYDIARTVLSYSEKDEENS